MILAKSNSYNIKGIKSCCIEDDHTLLVSDEYYNLGSYNLDFNRSEPLVFINTDTNRKHIYVVYNLISGETKTINVNYVFFLYFDPEGIHFNYNNKPVFGITCIKIMEVERNDL